ncbi:MAG: DUF3379 family protein [Pseudomonadota bacterium]
MNTNDIIERLWANPEDDSEDLAAAIAANPALLAEQRAARDFNAKLKLGMYSVNADAALRAKLLQIPSQEENLVVADLSVAPAVMTASNDSIWRRVLPVAACLILVFGLVLYYRPDLNIGLENEIFAHVYSEEQFLDSQMDIPLLEVNAKMEEVTGAHLLTSADIKKLDIKFAGDCWISKGKAMHLIMKGKTGPVSIIVFPSSMAASEFKIADARFNGIVTPTVGGGTLVVIGNKQEPIEEYRKLMSTNLDWEY